MRIILYTGKGGVGKTTVAAATALSCAERGHRTLVISTDPAHSLADAFDRPLGPAPTLVCRNLWGQEVNVLEEIRTNWGDIAQYLTALFSSRGIDEVVAEEMAVLPGTDELCALLQIRAHAREGRFDCLIVDCAPTAETLRLLSFPDAARWYMEKLFPWERRIMRTVRPAIQPLVDIPLPRDQVFAAIERLFARVEEVKRLLIDSTRSTVRLVLNPEKMVIKETQRGLTCLNLYGYAVDAVVNNRVFSEELGERALARWRKIQARYRQVIAEAFAPLPVWDIPFFDREVVGLPMLGRMAAALFADRDPVKVYTAGPVQTLRKERDGYTLSLQIPFARKEDIALDKIDDELAVSIGNFRRTLFLPRALVSSDVAGAMLEAGWLRIAFRQRARRATGETAEGMPRGRQREPRGPHG
ncbi:MAG: TRC40/GET3/ArsA family transport-energizing ATPase [Candidatus Rokubacteria bacterium]|nr:TRC40/GET3/ArsA family transport-energizing ATPase [Candidatus Rokubacteria bacterium]